jgi:hypothetical protein
VADVTAVGYRLPSPGGVHAGRAVIEQAKGILHAELYVSPEDAFHLLSRYSQSTNQRVRKVSARLVQGLISAGEFRSS